MLPSIAFVGAGPTTMYTLLALLKESPPPFELTVFEEQPSAGRGTPYRPGWNDPAMLSNIASIEIPPIETTLVDWLEAQPPEKLERLCVDPDKIGERTFYPRIALGAFFYEQFNALIAHAKRMGIIVHLRTRHRVTDAVTRPDGMALTIEERGRKRSEERFDHVVLATGHQWPDEPEVRPGYFASPWPASALAKIAPCPIGIRGTSLSAIDASVALAVAHGSFVDGDGSDAVYEPAPDTENFRMTMMSRKGLLPEADFFAPLPYRPLSVLTPEAVERLLVEPGEGLLDQAFELFRKELAAADPAYADQIGLASLSLEEFSERYFAQRGEIDPFAWAAANLEEAERNYVTETVVEWRYAILRMHEAIAPLVPYLEEDDFERFSRHFKPVFVDDYGTVPHKSIRRMIALHNAGKLDVLALGDDYLIDTHPPNGGAVLHLRGREIPFDVFIEATGQRALPAKAFPFPSLLEQGAVRDEEASDKGPSRGIAIDDAFRPVSEILPPDQLFCLSLPFLLGRHPFIQGITSSYEMGQVVGHHLSLAIRRDRDASGDPS